MTNDWSLPAAASFLRPLVNPHRFLFPRPLQSAHLWWAFFYVAAFDTSRSGGNK